MKNLRKFTCSLVFISLFNTVQLYNVQTEKDALAYLEYYGYVDPHQMPLGYTLKDCNKKLIEFQKRSHVKVTGKLDRPTLKAMNAPRCGCPDFIQMNFKNESVQNDSHYEPYKNAYKGNIRTHHHHKYSHRHSYEDSSDENIGFRSRFAYHKNSRRIEGPQNYVLSERRWNKQEVTYTIVKYPNRHGLKISSRDVDDAIHTAFGIWEKHINLKFRYNPNGDEADIEISFVHSHHGDNYPFEGPGKALAHAFFPGSGISGDIHFDVTEDWTVNSYYGVDVFHVAVHEIGHSLGLGHSMEYGAVMYPMYRGYYPNLELHSDDVSGIQAIYGRKSQNSFPTHRPSTSTSRPSIPRPTRPTSPPVPTEPTKPNTDLCFDSRIDGATTMLGQSVLIFKGANVYEVEKGKGVKSGWPKTISSYFPGLEGNIDCLLTRSNGKTYFFKGTKYWRFTGRQMDFGYPRFISQYFPGIPDNLDAAFEWDGEFVFTKGNELWRFNVRSRPQVESYFPMSVSHWGLTKSLDAALTHPNGSIYLFQDLYYWEFDRNTHQIKNADNGPGLISESWFGCSEP